MGCILSVPSGCYWDFSISSQRFTMFVEVVWTSTSYRFKQPESWSCFLLMVIPDWDFYTRTFGCIRENKEQIICRSLYICCPSCEWFPLSPSQRFCQSRLHTLSATLRAESGAPGPTGTGHARAPSAGYPHSSGHLAHSQAQHWEQVHATGNGLQNWLWLTAANEAAALEDPEPRSKRPENCYLTLQNSA